jgi:class 3 adenylate cyclase/tetratricopeptide (TPR) repeat protein
MCVQPPSVTVAGRASLRRSPCAAFTSLVSVTCPTCGTVNPADHRFCSVCGTPLHGQAAAFPIIRPSAPIRSERRLVSVLFADLVGFTSLSEDRDPEDVRAVLTAFFERARETIGRFGGVVDKFIGDAVMAVWGAIEAHEDDAERAVRAGLDLIDSVVALGDDLAVPLTARVGVLSGEASVGPGGNDRGLVVGDLVNTASRLQAMAEPGTVVVGESTFLAVGGAVQFESLGSREVRGRSEPVTAYRALRVATGRDTARPDWLEPPFLGRDDELRILKDQLHETAATRQARLVSIVGDPGIGKKQLARELRAYAEGISDPVLWHSGRSPSWGENAALLPVAEMVRSRLGIAETDEPAKSRLKLRTAIADLIPDERERLWMEPLIAGVLGLDDVPRDDRNELFAALRSFFQRVSERGTAVLVFEDLHQAEQTTLDFIAELTERSTKHPILIITLARPDLIHRRPDWASAGPNVVPMQLAPLPDEVMRSLVSEMVPGLPARAVESLLERAAGIPLYAVEFMRMLLASGDIAREGDGFVLVGDLEEVAVPDSLQSIIGARLDRLPPVERDLIQDAAVLGLTFYADGLAALRGDGHDVLPRQLDTLVSKELLALEDDSRVTGGGRYRFAQALIREVAYGRLSRGDRHSKHLRAAEHFESLGEIELAGKVARHYLNAYETAPRDRSDDLKQRACRALCSAATRAANLQAHDQALRLWEQSIAISDEPADRAEIHESAAVAALRAGVYDSGVRHAADAASIYEAAGDVDGRLRALTTQASLHLMHFHAPEAVALLEPFHGGESGTPSTRLVLDLEYARALMLNHEHARAAAAAEAALSGAEGVVGPEAIIDGIITRATALASLGRTLEAAALLRGATDLADEHQLHAQAARALNNLSVVVAADSPRQAGSIAMDMLERGRRFADSARLYRMRNTVAEHLIAEGRFDEAVALLGEVDLDTLPDLWQQMYRLTLASEEGYRRPSPEVFDRARDILAGWEDSTDPQMRQIVTSAQVSIDILLGDIASALARATPSELGAAEETPVIIASMWSRDPHHITQAMEHVDALPMQGRFTTAVRTLLVATLDAVEGRTDDAVSGFTAAIDILDAVGTGMDRAQARALFAATVGHDRPEAAAAGRVALEWIRSVGALQLERAWADGLPHGASIAAAG